MNSKEIKKLMKLQYGKPKFTDNILADNFPCGDLGRIFSVWFIKHNVTPNNITMLMIAFGIIGSILFAIPSLPCKILGYICWIMWYTMDNSDGQVARYTKNFSRYGTQMDFMAHLIDHPLMNIAIWLTFIQIVKPDDIMLLSLFSIMVISCEMLLRNITSFQFQMAKEEKTSHAKNPQNIFKYLLIQLTLFPNIIVLFSWIIIVDYWLRIGFSIYI
uniref:CDP-alcohol phosphatidyltransferase family protein n=1 Tax=Bacteroides acidifaciens TaxID=85831 RepID=UPI0025A9486B